jgi:pimeloyl-ACP methyl ester carboxylesterase
MVLMDTSCYPTRLLPMDVIHALAATGRTESMAKVAELVGESGISGFGSMDVEAFEALAEELDIHESLRPRLPELAMPVTVIVGENDHGMREAAEIMANEIQSAQLRVIGGAAHFPHVEQRDAWLAEVRDHLLRADVAIAT